MKLFTATFAEVRPDGDFYSDVVILDESLESAKARAESTCYEWSIEHPVHRYLVRIEEMHMDENDMYYV